VFSYIFMKILERRPRSYDRLMDKASRGHVRALKQAVVAEIPEAGRILEIGCGTGELAIMLADRGVHVDGFDISPAMVAEACKRIKTDNLTDSVSVRHMGVDGMDDIPDSIYDTVISTLVFSELSDDERRFALKHSARILKFHGKIIIADEAVPRTKIKKGLHCILRIPIYLVTYLVSRATTQPISDLTGELSAAGFTIEKEIRSQGDTFSMVVGRLKTQSKDSGQ
jgi:ubiquinone/menaquinone biosynthesis C-methylase UbiE